MELQLVWLLVMALMVVNCNSKWYEVSFKQYSSKACSSAKVDRCQQHCQVRGTTYEQCKSTTENGREKMFCKCSSSKEMLGNNYPSRSQSLKLYPSLSKSSGFDSGTGMDTGSNSGSSSTSAHGSDNGSGSASASNTGSGFVYGSDIDSGSTSGSETGSGSYSPYRSHSAARRNAMILTRDKFNQGKDLPAVAKDEYLPQMDEANFDLKPLSTGEAQLVKGGNKLAKDQTYWSTDGVHWESDEGLRANMWIL